MLGVGDAFKYDFLESSSIFMLLIYHSFSNLEPYYVHLVFNVLLYITTFLVSSNKNTTRRQGKVCVLVLNTAR